VSFVPGPGALAADKTCKIESARHSYYGGWGMWKSIKSASGTPDFASIRAVIAEVLGADCALRMTEPVIDSSLASSNKAET